jgi:hypothetical protein
MIHGLDCSGYRWKEIDIWKDAVVLIRHQINVEIFSSPLPNAPGFVTQHCNHYGRARPCFLFVDDVVSFVMLRALCAEYTST